MSVIPFNQSAYGFTQALIDIAQPPIVVKRAPTVNDKAQIGTMWINEPADDLYILTSIINNISNWQLISTGLGAVDQLSGNAGVANPAGGNINVIGGTNISTAGAGSTITINTIAAPTFSGLVTAGGGFLASGGNIVSAVGSISATLGAISAGTTITAGTGLTVTTGNATISSGNLVVTLGSVSANTTVTAGTNLVGTTGITVTAFGAGVVQSSAAGVFSSSNGTNGQVLIGGGAAPAWATITAGSNITITNAANAITIAANSGANVFNLTKSAVTPYVATATDYFIAIDCSGGIKTVQLPNAPATGRAFVIKDYTGNATANNVTVTTVGGAVLIDGATTYVLNTNYEAVQVIFDGTKYEAY